MATVYWHFEQQHKTEQQKSNNTTYRHDALQQARVRFRWNLPFHRPLLHNGCNQGIIHVEDAEARHVDTAEAIWLQVDGHQILLRDTSDEGHSHLALQQWASLFLSCVLSSHTKRAWRNIWLKTFYFKIKYSENCSRFQCQIGRCAVWSSV